MAHLNEKSFVVKVSELLRDGEEVQPILDAETINSIEQVIQELAGASKLVEIITE
jgi:hypothetical protein|tara:strand:- start:2401 stop:2565 length:165 start_codon:yes stop_codon:yes gene_type:complete